MWSGWTNPGASMRMKPFWFWNSEMEKEEIFRQIDEMAEKGLGGFFICARQGLTAAYQSEKWYELVALAVGRAREHGLEAWLYDEFPYPSGMAGGEMMLRMPGAKAKTIVRESIAGGSGKKRHLLQWGDILEAVAYPIKDGEPDHTKKIDISGHLGIVQPEDVYQRTGLTAYNDKRYFSYAPRWALEWEIPEGWAAEVYLAVHAGKFKYYGDYFDPGAEGAAQAFIDSTHEKMKRFLGDSLRDVCGVFTDETGFLGDISYTSSLVSKFVEKYGRQPSLSMIYGRYGEEAARERVRWFQLVHEILQHDWHQKIGDWCVENGLIYATEVPSLRATTQLYSGMPGGDSCHEKIGFPMEELRADNAHYRHDPRVPAALARQLDREHSMIEAFHSVGWTMTLLDARCMIDRMTAMGIDTVVQHAFYYSAEGLRKHDAPPSQFFQSTYWPHYKALTDYAGRLSSMLQAGEPQIEVAVVDPVSTLWSLRGNAMTRYNYRGSDPTEKALLDRFLFDWRDMLSLLEKRSIGFEPIDSEILNMAEIREGKAHIGRAAYTVIVLPPMLNLEGYAIEWLKRFIDAGGYVVSMGHAPQFALEDEDDVFGLRARLGAADESFFSNVTAMHMSGHHNASFIAYGENSLQEAVSLLADELGRAAPSPFTLTVPPNAPVLSRFTQMPDGSGVLFISNQGGDSIPIKPLFAAPYDQGYITLLDPEDGSRKPCPEELSLPPYQAVMLHVLGGEAPAAETLSVTELPKTGWIGKALSKNILRLADFALTFESPYGGAKPVPVQAGTLASQLAANVGQAIPALRMGGGFGIPPELSIIYPLDCVYTTKFLVDAVPQDCRVFWEDGALSKGAHVFFNGHEVRHGENPFLQLGENDLTIRLTAESGSDGVLDPIYLEGNFGVFKGELPIISVMPDQFDPCLAVQPGFPYYSGQFRFIKKINVAAGTTLSAPWLDKDFYDCASLETDTQAASTRPWAPYAWRIGAAAKEVRLTLNMPISAQFEGRVFDYKNHKVIET